MAKKKTTTKKVNRFQGFIDQLSKLSSKATDNSYLWEVVEDRVDDLINTLRDLGEVDDDS